MNIRFIEISIITLLLIGFSFSLVGQQAMDKAPAKEEADTTLTVKVKGVGCAMDIKTIADNVRKIDGVSSCETKDKGATTSFLVSYTSGKVERQTIHKTIEDTPGCKDPEARPYKVKN